MNQKLWSGLTAATLIIAAVGGPSASQASQVSTNDDVSQANVPQASTAQEQANSGSIALSPTSTDNGVSTTPSSELPTSVPTVSTSPVAAPVEAPTEVAKVGEYQSQDEPTVDETIASIQAHDMRGREAATLYVRNIPVLTFLGSEASSADTNSDRTASDASSETEVKVGSTQQGSDAVETPVAYYAAEPTDSASEQSANAAVGRASAMAAQMNQLYLNNINAEAITVRWNGDRQRYIIQVNGEDLIEMTPDIILPDSTNDPAQDALQATNRLRRLLGNAPPLRDIAGRPRPAAPAQAVLGAIRSQFTGMASWYGPGFHGNRSASGEVFNQHALTAAHRNLPFGTQVRVTNLSTGQSVVVRITDRGPHIRGRIIDLSAGAARVIGVINSGVAPVRLDVLGSVRTASN
jgi:rare lipoprotein A